MTCFAPPVDVILVTVWSWARGVVSTFEKVACGSKVDGAAQIATTMHYFSLLDQYESALRSQSLCMVGWSSLM
jgi:hypothetical protein